MSCPYCRLVHNGVPQDLECGIVAFAKHDFQLALNLLLPFAEAGRPYAQCTVASIYFTPGTSISQNFAEAFRWWAESAAQNHPVACHNLGTMDESGLDGVHHDYEKAQEYYRKAVDYGIDQCGSGET